MRRRNFTAEARRFGEKQKLYRGFTRMSADQENLTAEALRCPLVLKLFAFSENNSISR